MVQLWTAQYRYPGPHRLDITVKGKDPLGSSFAPTWDMVKDYKAGFISEDVARAVYIEKYEKLIADRLANDPTLFDKILERDYVVLVCFCPATHFCHRHIVKDKLVDLGAIYKGEFTMF